MRAFVETAVAPFLELLADWSWRWAVLIGLLALVLWVGRPRRAAVRQLLCLAILAAGLLLPLMPRWGPRFHLDADAPTSMAAQPDGRGVSTPTPVTFARGEPDEDRASLPLDVGDGAAHLASDTLPTPGAALKPLTWRHVVCLIVVGAWVLGLGLLALRRAAGAYYLHRLRQTATPVGAAAAELFAICRKELGLRRTIALAAHPGIRSPIAFGMWHPIILVPPNWGEQPVTVQRGPMLHELAHFQRRDELLNCLFESVRVLFFFHPCVHWLLARLERERELLCDETALQHGIDPHDYALALLAFAQTPGRLFGTFSPLRFGHRRTVKARITHLLEETMDRTPKPLSARRAWLLGTLVLACGLGTGSIRVFALSIPEQDAPKSEPSREADKPAAAPKIAREALRYDGKAFDQWRLELLTELKPEVRVEGINALTAFGINGYGSESIAAVLETVKGYDITTNRPDDQKVLNAGLDAASRIGSAAVPALGDAVGSDNKNIRRFAVQGLRRIGPDAKAAVPALLKLAANKDVFLRRETVRALTAIDPKADEVQGVYRKALQDEDLDVRIAALEAFTKLGPKARVAVPELVAVFRDGKDLVDRHALIALESIKPDLKLIIDPVMDCWEKDAHRFVHNLLLGYIREGRAEAAVAPLAAVLRKRNTKYTWEAIALLVEMGPAAKDAAGALQEFADNTKEVNMHAAALEALRKIREQ